MENNDMYIGPNGNSPQKKWWLLKNVFFTSKKVVVKQVDGERRKG